MSKNYPIRCIVCTKQAVNPAIVHWQGSRNHDNCLYSLDIPELPVIACDECGEVYFGCDSDEVMTREFRKKVGLLTPEEIKSNLKRLEGSHIWLAGRLNLPISLVHSYLQGLMIQSHETDTQMRELFGLAQDEHHENHA